MTRTWWVKRLFSASTRPARRTRPTARPSLLTLEDRTAPATLTEADAGKSLVITLDEANEVLTVVSAGTTYGFTTSATVKFQDGGVTEKNDFSDFNKTDLTLKASGLARYDTIRILDSQANTKVSFVDSGGSAYSDAFQVTLDGGSAGVTFELASDFGANPLTVAADAAVSFGPAAKVTGTGGLTFKANAVAIDTSGTPADVIGTGGRVTVTTFAAGNTIKLGGADAAGVLGLTDAELGQIKAAVLQVGDSANTGGVVVSAAVTAHAGYDTLALVTGGTVTQTAPLAVANLRVSATGAVTLADAGNTVGTVAAKGAAVTFVESNTLTVGAVDGVVGVSSTGGDVSITSGADDLLTVSQAIAAAGGNVTITTDRITIQAANGVTSPGVITIQQKSANWAIDLGSSTNLAANTLELFTVEVERLKAPTVRIGDPANAGGIALTGDIATDAGTTALVLRSGGAVTQTAGKTLTATKLAVTGTSVALDTGSHAVATVAGLATTGDFAFKSGASPGLTVGTVDGVIGVQAPGGSVTIRSVNDLTVTSALIDANDAIALVVGDGNAAGGEATVHGAFLDAPNGATITGGIGSDKFTVRGSPTTAIDVVGGNPAPPTLPGDVLVIDGEAKAVTVKYQGPDGSKGKVTVGALKTIGFKQIESFQVINALATETVVEGTAGNDVVVLSKVGGAVVFTLNGGSQLPVLGTKFTFTGLDGDDRLLVDFTGGDPALTGGVVFDGGNNTDTLQLKAAGLTGSYRPTGADGGKAQVGSQKIEFAAAEQADVFGGGVISVLSAAAADTLTVQNATSFGPEAMPALKVSGAAFAPVTLWGNNKAAIDTADAGGTDGNDTVTILSADNAHANVNLSVRTGTGTDTVAINGPVNVAGAFAVDSVAVNVTANVTAGATVTLTHTGALQLGAVTVSGTTGVTENGGGAVTLTGDATASSSGGPVSFGGAIDALAAGGQSLTVTAAGVATLSKSAGQATRLKALAVTGSSVALGGAAYKTQLGQTYAGPVSVSAAAVLFDAVGAVTFNGTLDGATAGTSAVTVTAGGAVTFAGAVGGSKSLASLSATGTTIAVNGGLVRTSAGQTYNSPVTVGQGTAFESTGGGAVTFNDTLAGAFAVAVNTTGAGTFAKAVTVASLTTDAGGTTAVNGGLVDTTAAQTYGDAVTVGADTVFRSTGGGAVAFNSTLDGGFKVTVETTGTGTFGGAVGGGAPLVSLTTNVGGTTQVNGGLVKTTGDQTYNDAVNVGAPATFQSTGAGVVAFSTLSGSAVEVKTAGATRFNGAVNVSALATDEPGTTEVNTATVTATGPGGLTFGDPVTASVDVTFAGTGVGPVTFSKTLTAAGKNVAVNTAGMTTFGGVVNVGTLTTDAAGTTAVNGGTVTTAGGQTYGDPVTVGANAVFASTGAGAISFGGSLDGGFTVAVNTAGTTSFLGPVGGAAPLVSLTTNVGGSTQVNGGLVKTSGGQTFNDSVLVGANATFASTGAGAVQFNVTLDGPGGAAVNTAGTVTFAGAVGGGTPLAFLTTDAGGATQFNGGLVRTTGNQTYNDGVTVGANTQFTTTAGGGVTFAATLTGANKDVTVNAAGTTTFGGAVNVGTLTTDIPGTTALATTGVTTAGSQTFHDAVLLLAPGGGTTTLTSIGGGDVAFAAAVDGPGGLVVATVGGTAFAGPVGGTTPLASLVSGAGGTTFIGGGLVRTAAGQVYGDAVVLVSATTFTAGTLVQFQQTLAGGFAVVTNSPQVAFLAPVDVGQLTVNAAVGPVTGVTVAGPVVSATAGQSYALPVAVAGDVTFASTAGDVTFGQPLVGVFGVAVLSPGTTTFGGSVNLASLATDAGGTTTVRGGVVVTSGAQSFGDAVVVADQNATFASAGGGNVVFWGSLSGAVGVAVNTAGVSAFNGPVGLASLSTDAPGVTSVNAGLVQTTGFQSFGDAVAVFVPATFQAGGDALFWSALSGPVDVAVQSPGTTLLNGPVNLASLATDAAGQTAVHGGSVTTTGGQSYADPVAVGTGTTFASTGGGGVVFGRTLDGVGLPVAVNTAGGTVFAGTVRLGELSTDAAGTTAFNGGLVTTDGSQRFHDPVTVGSPAGFAAGGDVLFGQTLSGPVLVLINAPGATTFGGRVDLLTLATDPAGVTVVNTDLVRTTGGQDYGDPVAVNVPTTFSGDVLTYRSTLTGGVSVGLASGGEVTFFAPVAVGSLTTDAGGRTVVRGGSVEATAGQSYGDDVLLGVTSRLATSGGDLSFLGRLDAEAAGAQGLTAVAAAGTLLFAGAVGSTGPVAFLAADAVTSRLAADVRSAGDVALTARGGGVEQPAGFLTAPSLGLFGSGTYTLDQLGSSLDSGNDVTGTFRANVSGPITLADRNDLTVDAAGVASGGAAVLLRTGRNFAAQAPGAGDARYGSPLVDVGGAEFRLDPGHFGPAMVTFDAEITAARALFGLGGVNNSPDEFRVRPSRATPFEVNGNGPGNPLLPGQSPDVLVPLFSGAQIAGFTFDGSNGVYTFNDRASITFRGFESLSRRALAGFVVQTGEPRDATGATQIQYAVRIVQTQALQEIVDGKVLASETVVPLPGGLDGKALLQNPFVVSPSFVNPSSPNAAPRLAFGDVNGDGAIDMILTDGPGSSPLVTVVDGRALNAQADGTLRKLEDLVQQGQVLAQFYAYDPRFLGGVNVTTADLDGDGSAEIITGAEQGGGPHVRVFNLAKGADIGFFVYEPTFTGGVRVAAADVNNDGVPDLVLGAGLNGGPRVTVVDGKTLAETGNRVEIANFFAYDPGFRGGIYVDAGDYNNDGFADVLTGPGVGGGSHIRVFSGKSALTGSAPVELGGFFAFTQTTPDNPLFTPGTPASGVGGVAFSGTSPTGSRNILVGTGRGPAVQVKEFRGNGGTPLEEEAVDLLKDQQFVVQGVNPETRVQNPIIFPLPTVLGYGASVGGFADPFAE